MVYLSTEIERAALRAMPLDSAFRGVPIDRVIKRLQEERSLVEGGHLAGDQELAVVILVENDDDEALRASIESVALQSLGPVRCVLVAPDTERVRRLERLITRLKLKPKDVQVWTSFDFGQRKSLQKQRLVSFASATATG